MGYARFDHNSCTSVFRRCKKKFGGQDLQALGRSRGGFSSKIHMIVDAHGNPLDFRITSGQLSDYKMAEELILCTSAEFVIADKGYDSDKIRTTIEKIGAKPVIPYRSSRKNPGVLDGVLYGARHAVENFFNKIKNYRSIACRYDKTWISYSAMLTIACILTWIKL